MSGSPLRVRRPTGWRWRACYFGALASATAALAASIASATTDQTGYGTGAASMGSVSLRINGRASHACSYHFLLPADLTGAVTCPLSVSYTGSIPAYLSLTIAIRSRAGAGGGLLYSGTNRSGLILRLTDGRHRFIVPTGPGRRGRSCPARLTCWTAPNELAAWYARGRAHLVFRAGSGATFTLRPLFGASAGNSFQGGSATVTLTAHAVQALANPLPRRCSRRTIGRPCQARGSFSWS